MSLSGLRIGHASDPVAKTGVTVFLPDAPAIAAVHVAGGAPASRETELLRPGNTVEHVDAIVLSGGSAFGLAAADGTMQWLAARGRGFAVAGTIVPIIPAASLFDLTNGGDKTSISPGAASSAYSGLAVLACEAATPTPEVGSVGAGTGATTADLKGGFGWAETVLSDGATVGAYVAVNAVGRVTLGSTPHFRAAPLEVDKEFGGLGLPSPVPPDAATIMTKGSIEARTNTTLAVIATDYELTRDQARRLAIATHDGLALAIFPAHTPFDGDTVFALATAKRPLLAGPQALLILCAAATSALARAVACAVYSATSSAGDRVPTWQQRYRDTAKV
jgi:L-aminopeptidase/D-esterase-like protein